MPISCRVISLCSFFLKSSVTFDTIGHLLLHEKLPPLGFCGTSSLLLHLADSIRELVLMDPLFLPCLCWHLSRLCHYSPVPLPSHCLDVFASCPGPTSFPVLMTLKFDLLPAALLLWCLTGLLMAFLDAACLRMNMQLSSWQLCSLSPVYARASWLFYSFGSVFFQTFPSKNISFCCLHHCASLYSA